MSSAEQQAKAAAEQFREKHQLGVQPLGDLVALIEQTTGHDVAVLDAVPDAHGLTMRDPARGRVFIGVARTPHPMRQRSTLAHELAHVVFDDQIEDLAVRGWEETRADAFARHLLIPLGGLEAVLDDGDHANEGVLSAVVQRYLVSPAMAAIALRDVGAISQATVDVWRSLSTRHLATRFGWSDFYATLQEDSNRLRAPQALVSRAVAGYAAGVLSAQAVATLRGVPVDTVVAELAEIGIVPQSVDAEDFEIDELPQIDLDLSDLEEGGASS